MASVRTTGAFVAAISMSMVLFSYFLCNYRSKRKTPSPLSKNKKPRNGLIHAVGNTPLIRINSLSEATGCEVSSRYALLLDIMIHFFHYFHF
jgi:cysteine synthase A